MRRRSKEGTPRQLPSLRTARPPVNASQRSLLCTTAQHSRALKRADSRSSSRAPSSLIQCGAAHNTPPGSVLSLPSQLTHCPDSALGSRMTLMSRYTFRPAISSALSPANTVDTQPLA